MLHAFDLQSHTKLCTIIHKQFTMQHLFHRRLKNNQRGDTIIEVVISIAVIASVLAGAFIVTDNSTHAVRDSEEHAEALQYVQGQIEILRSLASMPNNNLTTEIPTYGTYCFNSTGTNNPTGTNSNCVFDQLYTITINENKGNTSLPSGVHAYTATATWAPVNGAVGVKDNVELSYQVYVNPATTTP
jgi:type II secretory pathway pseudopilin PulG